MVGLLPPPHPSLLSSLNSKTIRLSSSPRPLTPSIHHISCRWNPRLSRLRPPAAGKARRIRIDRSQRGGDDDEEPSPRPVGITDEWGEKDEPEVDSTTEADLPKDDDEWGREESSSLSASAGALEVITDEWGEKTVPEQEEPATPDPPLDEDEWGNGSPAPEDKLGNLKRCLVDTFYGTELGLRANADVRSEILELVSQLEAENPTQAPNEALQLLDGNWILL
ncbi:hypothetical protein HPP92_020418 [Vanilla planifolia]|uniref:Plastid lipid-associated protein/fibrillin conserved domain-containing protein n=1 Tax=Vanilla planifolia TaxID=51239 RepID=A0A835Q2S3_VANPL|nr:hypothetical protein HPP92_020418 [Vanilla planifolia]